MTLFYKKKTAILTVAAIVVVVFLLCILLAFLTQLPSLNATKEKLTTMVRQAQQDEASKQALLEYRKTDKYVIDWAISMHLIPDDVVNYIKNEIDR